MPQEGESETDETSPLFLEFFNAATRAEAADALHDQHMMEDVTRKDGKE